MNPQHLLLEGFPFHWCLMDKPEDPFCILGCVKKEFKIGPRRKFKGNFIRVREKNNSTGELKILAGSRRRDMERVMLFRETARRPQDVRDSVRTAKPEQRTALGKQK